MGYFLKFIHEKYSPDDGFDDLEDNLVNWTKIFDIPHAKGDVLYHILGYLQYSMPEYQMNGQSDEDQIYTEVKECMKVVFKAYKSSDIGKENNLGSIYYELLSILRRNDWIAKLVKEEDIRAVLHDNQPVALLVIRPLNQIVSVAAEHGCL